MIERNSLFARIQLKLRRNILGFEATNLLINALSKNSAPNC